jgi:CubicO group peptidase (beta-lactamase class C family)
VPDRARLSDPSVEAALGRAQELGELGVQVCAFLQGELIIDTWEGVVERGSNRLVNGDTLFPIFSISKAVTATAVHIQASRGLIAYDAPLANYWPEYGINGKDQITVGHVLSHRAGVPQMPEDVTPEQMADWQWMTDRLAEMTPVAQPGTRNAYLSMTFGWLLGEVVRRTDPGRRPIGEFIHEEICEPLGMDSYFLGLPEIAKERVATLTIDEMPPPLPPNSLLAKATPEAVRLLPPVFNRPDVQAGLLPAVGAIANARSVARFFAMLAGGGELDGVRLLDRRRVEGLLEPRPDFDLVDDTYGKVMPVGVGGLWLDVPDVIPGGLGDSVLAHAGAGSTVAWADLSSGLACAICHNRMFTGLDPSPFQALGDAMRMKGLGGHVKTD